jgi:hypothetical protein
LPGALPPKAWINQMALVMTAPISTTNMTGLRTMWRGSSLRTLSLTAGSSISAEKSERGCERRSLIDVPPPGSRG